MLSYPACKINTLDNGINILQITDMHITMPCNMTDDPLDVTCQDFFEKSLRQALAEDIRCDLIIVTGDLVSQVETSTYDYIFEVLISTGIPFACIAGNHDVTNEFGDDLPYDQRRMVAEDLDVRLLNRHVVETKYWQLLLIDSSVPGKVSGRVESADIEWLCTQLRACDKPALLAVHHHVIPMYSDWIDAHMLENADEFWQSLSAFEHLHVIISGHTHQEQVRYREGVTVYSTPSTCYQFEPFEDEFSYDKQAHAGYRWLQLANNGNVASWVKRLDT